MGSFHVWLLIIEVIISLMAFFLGVSKRKLYAFGFALTFALFAWYDFVGVMSYDISSEVLSAVFFTAVTTGVVSTYLHVSDR